MVFHNITLTDPSKSYISYNYTVEVINPCSNTTYLNLVREASFIYNYTNVTGESFKLNVGLPNDTIS